MSNIHTTDHSEQHSGGSTKEIWNVTIILSVLTIVELALGFWMMKISSDSMRLAFKGVIVILMLVKAFYIVAYFMHLKHEIKNLIMTIVVPLALFVWFIIAFLYDGISYKNLRNNYDSYKKSQSEIKVEKKEAAHSESHKIAE